MCADSRSSEIERFFVEVAKLSDTLYGSPLRVFPNANIFTSWPAATIGSYDGTLIYPRESQRMGTLLRRVCPTTFTVEPEMDKRETVG